MCRTLTLALVLLAAAACKRSSAPPAPAPRPALSEAPTPERATPRPGDEVPGHGSMAAQHQVAARGPSDVAVQKVARAPGTDGRTVQELWAQRAALNGKRVAVRGQIVKLTPVMGKNFLHLRDGSGKPGQDDDVTVTTADRAAVGEVVTARGRVVIGKDFGAGYTYPVLVEDATLSR